MEGCYSKLRIFNLKNDDFRLLQVIYSSQTLRGFIPVSPKIFGYFDQSVFQLMRFYKTQEKYKKI